MSDRYLTWAQSNWGKRISKAWGLPRPTLLNRRSEHDHPSHGLLGAAPDGELWQSLTQCLESFTTLHLDDSLGSLALIEPKKNLQPPDQYGALVLDASGIKSVAALEFLHQFFQRHIRQLTHCGRVLVLARPPEHCKEAEHQIAQRALEGFTRSLCKELRFGSTGHLIYVAEGAEQQISSTVQFCCSARSAYVSAQVIRLQAASLHTEVNSDKPLAGKTALVTGAARGIGAAIARTLAADGASVIGLDVPSAAQTLDTLMKSLGGDAIALDITDANTPSQLCQWLKQTHGGIDIVVHNAGVTRDKLLANMPLTHWQLTLDINLAAPLRINNALLESQTIRHSGRIIGVSSISGIAGNAGQTNYSTSKAGVVGLVDAYTTELAHKNITVNAVAPGFIETEMTAKVPLLLRQAGRRMNSLKQGGQPVDVAETIAWLASPASGAVNGNTIRVCGQSLLGA